MPPAWVARSPAGGRYRSSLENAMWIKLIGLCLVGLVAAYGLARLYGASRWQSGTEALRTRLSAARSAVVPKTFDPRELEGLPFPVQRYFNAALRPGQPMIAAVHVTHAGTFNMGETRPSWKPFTSTEVVTIRRPGFDWDGRIGMAPGVPVRVHDAYVAGVGHLEVRLLGLIKLVELGGTADLARGELLRYLAETMWYPTALLPSQGVVWEPLDESSARATLIDGDTTASLDFHFAADGLIESTRAASRPRTLGGTVVASPWGGRGWQYEQRDGMRIPMASEVAWLMPEGEYPYWRAEITSLRYEFAR